jgi:hypothetical protein
MTKKKQEDRTPSEHTKSQLYAKLSKLGIASVLIVYDGCGDSGCIESIQVFDARNCEVELPNRSVAIDLVESRFDGTLRQFITVNVKRTVPIKQAVENWCYDLLEQHFGGWENNDGSQGTIKIDVMEKSATIEHEENVMRSQFHRVVV